MKIEDNRETGRLLFSDLDVGDVFVGGLGQDVFIKVGDCDAVGLRVERCNAVRLSTGGFDKFSQAAPVQRIEECKLVLCK